MPDIIWLGERDAAKLVAEVRAIMCMPSPAAVLASGGTLNLTKWEKHRGDGGQPYDHCGDYVNGHRLTRADVFAHFGQSIRMGIISTIKWGYPNGTSRGNWQGFSDAFRSNDLVNVIDALQGEPPQSALEIVQRLNAMVTGIGTATTTKLAYFARLTATEGQCLIYDSMVRRAIRARCDPEFAELRERITGRKSDIPLASDYGLYLQATHAMALRLGVQGDQIELFLFIGRENAAALPPYP